MLVPGRACRWLDICLLKLMHNVLLLHMHDVLVLRMAPLACMLV